MSAIDVGLYTLVIPRVLYEVHLITKVLSNLSG